MLCTMKGSEFFQIEYIVYKIGDCHVLPFKILFQKRRNDVTSPAHPQMQHISVEILCMEGLGLTGCHFKFRSQNL